MAEESSTPGYDLEEPVLLSPHEEALVSGEDVTFRWKPIEEADRYLLEVARGPGFDDMVFQQECAATETSFTLAEALPTDGALYYWRVRARRGEQWSPGDRVESFISVTEEQAEAADEAPDRSEGYGPAAELVGAAGVEAGAEATGSKPLVEEERQIEREMGVAHEGVEAGQIVGLMGVVVLAILVIVVVLIYWISNVADFQQQAATEISGYPELEATRTEAAQQLSQYELMSEEDSTYRIPIDEAMRLVADEAYQPGAGRTYTQELPLRPPASDSASDSAEARTPAAQVPAGPAGN